MDSVVRDARIAGDRDAPMARRLDALSGVVTALAHDQAQLFDEVADALVDAVDDLALVDAAVAKRQAGAVCAVLHLLGPRPELDSTRKRIVRRLVAAGATGIALAGLAFAIGDLVTGTSLAARDFAEHVAMRCARPASDPLVDAWLGWLAARGEPAIGAVLAALRARGTDLATAFAHVTDPAAVARLRTELARTIGQ